MITPGDVTACLVTRGDQPEMMERILDSLIFDDVEIWDNSIRADVKTAGRYGAAARATRSVVYFQDDDVIVPPDTQRALVAAYEPGVMVANWGHGVDAGDYEDVPLVGAGAIVDKAATAAAMWRYFQRWPMDDGFRYDCDFALGPLYPKVKHLRLPFHIELEIAQHPSRLCNQPWQVALKREIANRARQVRDEAVAA